MKTPCFWRESDDPEETPPPGAPYAPLRALTRPYAPWARAAVCSFVQAIPGRAKEYIIGPTEARWRGPKQFQVPGHGHATVPPLLCQFQVPGHAYAPLRALTRPYAPLRALGWAGLGWLGLGLACKTHMKTPCFWRESEVRLQRRTTKNV